jgi:hypothetical protein
MLYPSNVQLSLDEASRFHKVLPRLHPHMRGPCAFPLPLQQLCFPFELPTSSPSLQHPHLQPRSTGAIIPVPSLKQPPFTSEVLTASASRVGS